MKKLTSALILLFLLAGTALTIWGLTHLQWPQALPWSDKDALMRYVKFLAVCIVSVIGGSLWSRKPPLFIGSAVAAGLALLSGALWPLLATLWFAVASALLGGFILKKLRIGLEGNSRPTSFLVGAGVYGTAVGLLAHFPVSYPGVYGVALALPIMLGRRVVAEEASNLFAWAKQRGFTGLSVYGLDVAIAVVALVYLVVALMPEVGHDALAMHLFVPAHLAMRHQWGFDASTYVWAVMPMLGDWVFSIGYMLAGETAVRLINVGFILIVSWLVRDLVLWAGGSCLGARWAVLIFLSTPLTFTEGSSLHIESIWAAFAVGGAFAVLRSGSSTGTPKFDLPLAGILLGCALATKATSLPVLPVLLLLLAWRYKYWHKGAASSFAIGAALLLSLGFIPYLTAWWLTGNPVFPFFNGIFKSPFYPAINFDSAEIFGKGLTWDVLYRATFESGKYLEAKDGASGFQWLLLYVPAAIALFAAKNRKGIALMLVGSLIVAFVFQSVSYFRYAFPAWAILAAAMGVALSTALTARKVMKYPGYAAALAAVLLNIVFLNAGAQYSDFALQSLGDETHRKNYLRERLPIRSAVDLVNQLNTGRAPVAVFSPPMTAGLSADALYPSWYNNAFQGEVAAVKTEQGVSDILLHRNVLFVILDSNWNGVGNARGPETRAFIEKASEQIAEYGSLSVRKVKEEYRFKTELLNNPDFTSIQGWSLAPGATFNPDTKSILVSNAAAASQSVAIISGRRYLNTIVARCAKETSLGRIQINWLDADGQFVATNINTFECASGWAEHKMKVTAPPNSANAVVYVSGHTPVPLEYKSDSLRQ